MKLANRYLYLCVVLVTGLFMILLVTGCSKLVAPHLSRYLVKKLESIQQLSIDFEVNQPAANDGAGLMYGIDFRYSKPLDVSVTATGDNPASGTFLRMKNGVVNYFNARTSTLIEVGKLKELTSEDKVNMALRTMDYVLENSSSNLLKDEVINGRNCYHMSQKERLNKDGVHALFSRESWIDKEHFIPMKSVISSLDGSTIWLTSLVRSFSFEPYSPDKFDVPSTLTPKYRMKFSLQDVREKLANERKLIREDRLIWGMEYLGSYKDKAGGPWIMSVYSESPYLHLYPFHCKGSSCVDYMDGVVQKIKYKGLDRSFVYMPGVSSVSWTKGVAGSDSLERFVLTGTLELKYLLALSEI